MIHYLLSDLFMAQFRQTMDWQLHGTHTEGLKYMLFSMLLQDVTSDKKEERR